MEGRTRRKIINIVTQTIRKQGVVGKKLITIVRVKIR